MPIVTTSSRKRNFSVTPFCIAIVIAIVVASAILYFRNSDSAPDVSAQALVANTLKPVHVAVADDSSIVQEQPTSKQKRMPLTKEQEFYTKTKNYVKKPGQMLLPEGRILTFPPPKEGEYRIVHSHGKQYKCDSEGNWEDITPKPIFDNSFEESLIGLSVDGGAFIPGMLIGLDKDAVNELLHRDVVINEDDSEDVVAKKEAVAQMKGVILDYIDNGGTFDQFVMEIRALSTQERSLKTKALRQIVALYKEGKYQEAQKYREDFDAVLSEQGFSPVKLPTHIRKALGESTEASSQK